MKVNEHGLMHFDDARELCSRYICRAVYRSDLVVDVQHWSSMVRDTLLTTETVVAVDPGWWRPLDLITACRVAKGQPVRKINVEKAKITNPGNLNEFKIARHLAAIGVRPYLVNQSRYRLDAAGVAIPPPQYGGYPLDRPTTPQGPGDWTWTMRKVMLSMERPDLHGVDHTTDWRDSVYVLRNSGLIRTTSGNVIGRASNVDTHRWTQLAYFDPRFAPEAARPTEPEQLDIDDEAAIAALAGI